MFSINPSLTYFHVFNHTFLDILPCFQSYLPWDTSMFLIIHSLTYFNVFNQSFPDLLPCFQSYIPWHTSMFSIIHHNSSYHMNENLITCKRVCILVFGVGDFLAFDYCRFCLVIRFFHPRHNGHRPQTSKDFYTRSYPLHLFSYLNSWERASISLFNVEC